jgi:uncharacterized protein (DUF433 family)
MIPNIQTSRIAAALLGVSLPCLRGTGIRVQTIALAGQDNTADEIAADYDLPPSQVQEALGFYEAHRVEIDAHIQAEAALEPKDE